MIRASQALKYIYDIPIYHVHKAALYFRDGGFAYHFDIPENRKPEHFTARIRSNAKRLGYKWRVSHNIGRAWIIKEKVIK